MLRNFAWLLCAFLLCFGQTLSEKDAHVNSAPEVHEEKAPAISPKAPHSADPAPHSESDAIPRPTTPKNDTSSSAASTLKSTVTPTPPALSSSSTTTPASTSQKTSPTPASTSPKTSPTPPPSPVTPTTIPVTPTPAPQKGSWSVTNNNITCLRIDGIFSIDFIYPIGNKTNATAHYDVPKEANSKGTCEDITLYWPANSSTSNRLKFIFKKENNQSYSLHSFAGSVYIPKLNKTENFNTNTNETYFKTPIGQSYSCSSMRKVTVNHIAKVTLDEFHLQAFKTSNTTGFDKSTDCAGSTPHTADIVPIVVGCVLALLVIAVLVAYLISRRRSQTRGYLSM